MCRNSTEENWLRYVGMKKKAVSKAVSVKAEEALAELQKLPKWDA